MKEGLFGKRATLVDRLLTKFSLTYWGIIKRMVGSDFVTILDAGCGTGTQMELIDDQRKYNSTGVDIYEPYLKECRRKKIYNKLLKCDIRSMPFKEKSFDVVICFHVVEHLKKKEGYKVIKNLEAIAEKRVILVLPNGSLPQEEYDHNEFQEHKSEWYPKDLQRLGYRVVGQGLKAIYGVENIAKKYGIASYFIFFLSMIFQPLLFFKPDYGVYMICRKDINK